ncbi:hypothetical protein HMI01_22110 [Halolactibacillus miurensis]|uniref:Tetratricopeptide repeat-containing protein n=1 Tax=Halolactibacillus miurensis TaxID=306541 RepID=A0A1I6UEQ8_9BACI|nr:MULTISPECIES: tetratricopeptide repeat protein [Halolactibacillus]GEM05223.1 hypothetical protein HMI01_22110 [Halolactibacillus miurensis]SFS99912.1 hypothetical protein SAMN05421668_12540 [Halolactibacillus miurensis]
MKKEDQGSNRLVLFPKEQERLEKEAFDYFRGHQYKKALPVFDELIAYGVHDVDIMVAKVTCLAELGELREAELFLETMIDQHTDDYLIYIHIYATLLFQFHKHKKVKELLETVLVNVKDVTYRHQFENLLEINEPLVDEEISSEITVTKRELNDAMNNHNTLAQWHLINHLQQSDITPYLDMFKTLLTGDTHPVVQSVIISLMQANRIDEVISIHKFNQEMMLNPKTYPYFTDHPVYKDVQKMLREIEERNPSFYRLAMQILERFIYVRYPFVEEEDAGVLKEAIVTIVNQAFNDPKNAVSKEVEDKLIQLMEAEQLYFSLLEE